MKLGDKKVQLLTELEIEEISLVDKAANAGSEVLFYKMDQSDFNKLNSCSVEKLTAAMESIDYAKIGTTPAELWDDFVAEFREAHNQKLSERKKNPPKNLTQEQVEELRQRKPWSLSVASQEARKTPVGQGLWAMVENTARENAAKRDAALIRRLDKMGDEVEGLKKSARETIEIYDKIKRGRTTKMETIEEVTKAALDGEFPNKLKAWAAVEKVLKNRVSKSTTGADFNQTLLMAMTQPSWNEFYAAYTGLPEARIELKKAEVRKIGKAETEINKRAQEMLDKGLVNTFEKGVVRVTEIHPELEEQYRQEMYG